MNTKIKVTKRDIERGTQDNPYSCPVALAIRRKLKTDDVRVGERNGYIEIGCVEVRITKRVWEFITEFDAGNRVAPIEFSLPLRKAGCAAPIG